jgi:hypothetical protein
MVFNRLIKATHSWVAFLCVPEKVVSKRISVADLVTIEQIAYS